MDNKLIISLTTIDSRLDLISNVIKSILTQTYLPDIIHIFYSSEPFFYDNGISDDIINKLKDECQTIKPEILFTNTENIGSYRKLIPALKIYKNNIIITIDDDILFEPNFIEKYIEAYNKYKCIIYSIGKSIDLKNINNNNNKKKFINIKPTFIPLSHIIPEGYGGILYHTNMFDTNFINLNFKEFPELILKNDDVFFRLYTFKKNIKVFNIEIHISSLLDFSKHKSLYINYNNKINYINVIYDINTFYNEKLISMISISNINNNFNFVDDNDIIDMTQELINIKDVENIINANITKDIISSGTDAKQFQYEYFAFSNCNNIINLKSILEEKIFKKEVKSNFILINIEKDVMRYISATNEYKKIIVTDFIHLKATYWKEKQKMITDLKFIIEFMSQFNPLINKENINNLTISEFSELNDTNILIQDGPLACYCSHVRAMIYGYLHFEDYTIITEDDILIANTENINKYIQLIPDDWDIICLNAIPINIKYDDKYYKFKSSFHSAHFYIIKNRCLPFLFSKLYPIYDQVDLLIAKLYNELNIYNITDTVYQKNYSTNTQNNLYVILNSPNYKYIRDHLDELNTILTEIINILLPNNIDYNFIITSNIIFDVIYNYIINNLNYENINIEDINIEDINDTNENNNNSCINSCINSYIDSYTEFCTSNNDNILLKNKRLYDIIFVLTNCCVKGINVTEKTWALMNDINHIVSKFTLHNTFLNNNILKAYSYGSTSNTYLCGNMVIKAYNSILRWTHIKHNNINDIFNKELAILNKLSGIPNTLQLINDNDTKTITNETKFIKIIYMGCSLYNNFILPEDWKEQITNNFNSLTQNKIYYPEFNLKNIVYLNSKLSFIDYGLAELISDDEECNNIDNCSIFIELLTLLDEKFKSINSNNTHKKQVLYITFINNIKISNDEKYKNNIY
jgi:hypothetical protein